MTEQEITDAVTAKLTGEFYVGQRIRFKTWLGVHPVEGFIYLGKDVFDTALIQMNETNRISASFGSIEPL